MEKVSDDLKFGLSGDTFFSGVNMAATSRHLGELGYKNTEIIPLWFDKIIYMLDHPNEVDVSKSIPFEQAVYGGHLNFVPRHYIFQGFESNQEF